MRLPFVADVIDLIREGAYLKKRREWQRLDREQPFSFHDEILGEFRFNRELRWFEAKRLWNGIVVKVTINSEFDTRPDERPEQPDLGKAARLAVHARAFWDDEAEWLDRMQVRAVADLLTLANDWQADDGPISEAQFRERMTIQSLAVNGDDDFDAWFADGDLFWGHSILVYGTWANGPMAAEMLG